MKVNPRGKNSKILVKKIGGNVKLCGIENNSFTMKRRTSLRKKPVKTEAPSRKSKRTSEKTKSVPKKNQVTNTPKTDKENKKLSKCDAKEKAEPKKNQSTKNTRSSTVKENKNRSRSEIKENPSQVYEFDQSDEDGIKMVLFPEKTNTSRNKSGQANVKSKTEEINNKSTRKRKATAELDNSKETKVAKKVLTSRENKDKQIVKDKVDNKKTVNRKQKENTSKAVNVSPQHKENEIKGSKKWKQTKLDQLKSAGTNAADESGLFLSPVLRRAPTRTKRAAAAVSNSKSTATSTPSPRSLVAAHSESKSTPLEFQQAPVMPSPMLSPVMNMSPIEFSPKRQTGRPAKHDEEIESPNSKLPQLNRTYSGRGSIGSFLESLSPMPRQVKKPAGKTKNSSRRDSTKYDAWAMKMSLELEEAESYELSVED